MPLSAGSKLGPYEILSLLGAGGMGEVYKARDTRLERTVAVKVLPAHTAGSPEARQRFEREARTISQLSHPHICALYDVGREGDVEYLVMELLEGETLSDRLAKGPLSRDQTLRYGEQIADALDKAHRQGVVHRDLKPANVMLTKTGVKLLDFGLAKGIAAADSRAGGVTSLPTQQQQRDLTQEGAILGTFQYMAPEQLEGKEADARTDIHALGAVLYEMATGRKAFVAASQASLITAIMSADPPSITSLLPMAPPALDRIVRTCLAKDPEERWQSAADVRRELLWIGEGSSGEGIVVGAARRGSRMRERVAWAAAVLALSIGAVAVVLSRRPAAVSEPIVFSIEPPTGLRFVEMIALSPDGRKILVRLVGATEDASLWVRSLDSLEIRRLAGTNAARFPFWSSDGREIAFFAGGKLKRISVDGGPVQTICDSGSGFGGAWGRDGTILFTAEFGTPIVAVSAAGGTPRPVTSIDAASGETAHFFPDLLPDGRHFVFAARHLDPEKTEVRLGALGESSTRPLFRADSAAIYSDPGYLLYAKDNAIFARRFDASSLRLVGDAIPAFQDVRYGTEENRLAASAAANRIAYLRWPQRRRLVWVDRRGRELSTVGEIACYEDVRLSPDNRRIAVSRRDPEHGQNMDVWMVDAVRGTSSRVTGDRADEFAPAWFPDGERLVFVSDRGGSGYYDLYEVAASGGPVRALVSDKHDKTVPSVSRDGRSVVFSVAGGGRYRREIASLKTGERRPLGLATRFTEHHPEISPDGRWVAFDSDSSGTQEIYVEALAGGASRAVSVGGGHSPTWRADGKELFYVARDGMLMTVSIGASKGAGIESGDPQPLFPLEAGSDPGYQILRRPYDAANDGSRFLVIRRAPDAGPEDAVVVLNWTSVLAGKSRP